MINYQNENDCEISSMQPHHDTRGNDLKIYVWLSDYNEKSHPLYYLKGSNNDLKFFITDKHHRRKDIPKEKMDKIYGRKGDIIIFVEAKKSEINNRLKRRPNFNLKIFNKLKKIQLPVHFKKKKANFIIKNDFKNVSLKKNVKVIKKKILKNERSNS